MSKTNLNLVPLPKTTGSDKFVALDAFKRLALSSGLRQAIGLPRGEKSKVYIFVDRANKYIAFAKPDDVTLVKGGNLFTVSKRGYVYAPAIFDALAMPIARAVFKYDDTAEMHGVTWHLCQLDGTAD